MELRHLRCFLAVSQELHFGRAAEKLHIDQSPLSRTIKELEEEPGAPLFIRTTRSTRLIKAGHRFLEHMPRIFTALELARDSVKSATNGFHDQLRIALSNGITPSRLPTLLARCREEDPEIDIRLFEVPLEQQIKGLHDDCMTSAFRWPKRWATALWSGLRGKTNCDGGGPGSPSCAGPQTRSVGGSVAPPIGAMRSGDMRRSCTSS